MGFVGVGKRSSNYSTVARCMQEIILFGFVVARVPATRRGKPFSTSTDYRKQLTNSKDSIEKTWQRSRIHPSNVLV
jgi:hypothetical protein